MPRANADTQPTMGVEDADEGDDDDARENDGPTLLSTFNDSKRVDCTPIDAMTEQPSKPPTLKRPGAMRAPTHEHSSMVTASARPLGSIGSEHGEVMGVARTAIEAVKRARAKMNEPLGLDMSMPQCDDDSQLVDDDADDVVEATPMAAERRGRRFGRRRAGIGTELTRHRHALFTATDERRRRGRRRRRVAAATAHPTLAVAVQETVDPFARPAHVTARGGVASQ